jgi:hypothetical protein
VLQFTTGVVFEFMKSQAKHGLGKLLDSYQCIGLDNYEDSHAMAIEIATKLP